MNNVPRDNVCVPKMSDGSHDMSAMSQLYRATNTTFVAAARINGVRATALVLPNRSIFAPPMTAKTRKPDHYRSSIKRSSR
jgi:hypothetical protein